MYPFNDLGEQGVSSHLGILLCPHGLTELSPFIQALESEFRWRGACEHLHGCFTLEDGFQRRDLGHINIVGLGDEVITQPASGLLGNEVSQDVLPLSQGEWPVNQHPLKRCICLESMAL